MPKNLFPLLIALLLFSGGTVAFAKDAETMLLPGAMGRLPQVRAEYEAFIAAREVSGEESRAFADAAHALGARLLEIHEFDLAVGPLEDALLAYRSLGAEPRFLYEAGIAYGRAQSLAGDYEGADRALQDALSIALSHFGEASRETGMAYYELAYTHLRRSPERLEGFGRYANNRIGFPTLFVEQQLGNTSIEELTDLIDDHLDNAERAFRDARLRNSMDYALVMALRGRYRSARDDHRYAEDDLFEAIERLETRPVVDDDLIHAYAALLWSMQMRTLRNRRGEWRDMIEHARQLALQRPYGEFIQIARVLPPPIQIRRNAIYFANMTINFDINAEGLTENVRVQTQSGDTSAWADDAVEAVESFVFATHIRDGVSTGQTNMYSFFSFSYFGFPF